MDETKLEEQKNEDTLASQSDNVETVDSPTVTDEEPTAEKTFTQDQLNEIVGKTRTEARERAIKDLLDRYGVESDEALNDLFGKGQAYGVLNEDYHNAQNELQQLKADNALLRSNINSTKWDDVKAILSYKNLDINEDNIRQELSTHPEWANTPLVESKPLVTPESAQQMADNANLKEYKPTPKSVIKALGNDTPETQTANEEERIKKIFNL